MLVSVILLSLIFLLIIIGALLKCYDFKGLGFGYRMSHFIYPGAALLMVIIGKFKDHYMPWSGKDEEYYSKVYIGEDIEKIKAKKSLEPAVMALGIIIITSIFGIILSVKTSESKKVSYLVRPEYGQEKVNLITKYNQEEIPIELTIESAVPSKKEMERRVNEAIENLPKEMLKDNSSYDCIESSLYMPEYYKNKSTKVSWYSSNSDIVNHSGYVNRDKLYEDTEVTLTMKVSCFDEAKEETITLIVKPDKGLVQDKAYLVNKLNNYLDNTKDLNEIELPDYVNGEEVKYFLPIEDNSGLLAVFGLILAVLFFIYGGSKKKELLVVREKQLLVDFEECVSKLLLYANCGQSISTSFAKIAANYEKKGGKKRYVYEEMLKTSREMQNGKDLARCFEDFGRRCENIYYIRLGAILSRQLLRGGDGFITNLKKEITEVRREKQATIRKKGEEASIKLLAPMCGMFVVVLAIVVIPAFMNL